MSQISVNNLTFYYDGSFDNVFENVSFSIDTNWKLGFIGRNGKGKTTLVKIILGLVYPSNGKIHIEGSVSYVTDHISFPKEEVIFNFLKVLTKEKTEKINQMLNRYEIEKYKNYKFKTLSKGTLHKVLIISGLILDRDIYIFDEPLNGLDNLTRKSFLEDVLELKRQNKIVIIITHLKSMFIADDIVEVEL